MISGSEVLGRGRRKILTLAANTTIKGNNDVYLVDATAGNVTITLPDSKAIAQQEFVFKKTDSSGNTVTIQGENGQTIDGNATVVLSSQNATLQVIADGANFTETVVGGSGSAFNGGTITTALTINAASTTGLAVGPNGTTNPVLQVDTNVASQATGLLIQGKAAGSNIVLQVQSSGANEGVSFKTKGTGTFNIQPGTSGDSTSFFRILNAAGTVIYKIDTTNARVRIGDNTAPTSTLDLGGDLTVSAHNIITDTTTGMKIGTSASQKLGFFNATPVVQPTKAGHNNWAAIADVTAALAALGLVDVA